MKKNMALLMILLTTSVSSIAADGTIHFTGSIVNPVCDITTNEKTIDSNCSISGKTIKRTQVISDMSSNKVYEDENIKTKLEPIIGHDNLKILLVEYK